MSPGPRARLSLGCVGMGLFAAAIGAAAIGCKPRPVCHPGDLTGCVIEKVEIEKRAVGTPSAVDDDDLKERLATAESSWLVTPTFVRTFGEKGTLFLDYERLDRLVVDRDVARIERYYRSRGYYNVRVRAARVFRTSDLTVRVQFSVDEGKPVWIGAVEIENARPEVPFPKPPDDFDAALEEAKSKLPLGTPLDEAKYDETKQALLKALQQRGFAYAEVEGHVDVDLGTSMDGPKGTGSSGTARVKLRVNPGPRCRFGRITFEGLGDLPELPLRAALGIRERGRYSTDALDAAQAHLADFGVFSSIEAIPVLSPPGAPQNPEVPIRFVVQRSALRTLRFGAGAELGSRVEGHGLAGWEDRNFFGGLRRFSVEARPGFVLYPLRLDTLFDGQGIDVLPEVRTLVSFKQPALFEARTNGYASLAFNLYQLQTSTFRLASSANLNLYEYLEAAGSAGLERKFWRSRLSVALGYQVQYSVPFAYKGQVPEGFSSLLLSRADLVATLDLRRGPPGAPAAIQPRSGIFAGAELQVAGLGGDIEDVRIRPEIRGYIPLGKDVVLGAKVVFGLLFPRSYGTTLGTQTKCRAFDAACNDAVARDLQIMQLRGFFSGGVNSNRGYGYNGVGPIGTVRSLFTNETSKAQVPLGGQTLWESSLELRFPVIGSFGGALFLDGSDVYNTQFFELRPHLSAGLGLRYATPVGPARVDVGVRIPCAQAFGTCENRLPGEADPGLVLGLPMVISVAIGESF